MKLPLFLLATLLFCEPAAAEVRAGELKNCLADFGGIAWSLPYLPPIRIRSCAGPTARYDTADDPGPDRRVLELIGELTLGRGPGQLPSDETYGALQDAMHAHFDALFRRHGFRQVAREVGNARTQYPFAPPKPPIPYISVARYERLVEGKLHTLTFSAEMRNTWRVKLQGLKVDAL